MNRLFITLFCWLLSAPWALSQQEAATSCPSTLFPHRGDIVCEDGQLQVTQVFDYDIFALQQEILKRVAPLNLPDMMLELLASVLKYPVKGYSVKYWTLNTNPSNLLQPRLVKATGLVVIPGQPNCNLPLAVYCHGTIFGRDNVPSQPDNFQEEFIAVLGYATSGYLTVAPDYVGMGEGSSDFHPYLDARTEAAASIDLMRAARKIAGAWQVPLSGDVFIAGHSQGGRAGMATLRSMAYQFPLEFDVKFTGLSSGPYDLSYTQFNYIFNNPNYPGEELTLMVLAGGQESTCSPLFDWDYCSTEDVLKKKYIQNPYTKYILRQDEDAREAIDLPWRTYFRDDYLAGINHSDLRQIFLRSNDVYDWLNLHLTFMFYCQPDERVDYQNAIKTEEVQRNNIPDILFWLRGLINSSDSGPYDHVTCAFPSLYATLLGFNETRSDCSSLRSEAPSQSQVAGIQVPSRLYFDAEIDFRDYPGRLTSIEMVDQYDQVVRKWQGEALRSGRITLERGELPAGLYALVFRAGNAAPHYAGILIQNPKPMVSNLYDPISPNPMRETAELDLSLLDETVLQISIYDPQGRLFHRMYPEAGMKSILLQRRDLPAGDYLVEVRAARQSYFLPLQLEPAFNEGLRIAPNPMKDQAWIELSDLEGDVQLIQLFSVDGRLVRTYTGLPAGTPRMEIHRGDLAAGVYFVEITTSTGKEISRLVVE